MPRTKTQAVARAARTDQAYRRLRDQRRQHIADARALGATWDELGAAFGMTKQGIRQMAAR